MIPSICSILITIVTILYFNGTGNTGHIGTRERIPSVSIDVTYLLILLAILDIYFAPYGSDRIQYKMIFEGIKELSDNRDSGWVVYNSIIRFFIGNNADIFFLLNDIIYTVLFYQFAKHYFKKDYIYYFLLLLFISLGYRNGGTNIMRSGLATAIIYYALTKYEKKILFIVLALIAITIHKSVGVIIGGLILGYYYPKIKIFLSIWIICIILSPTSILGSVFEPFANMIGGGERLNGYIYVTEDWMKETYLKAGWRIDFIIYSILPMLFVYYYKVRCNYHSKIYDSIIVSYLISNSMWLCVIKMMFSDRFALLSWVFIPVLTLYPILRDKSIPKSKMMMTWAYLIPLALNLMYLFRKF